MNCQKTGISVALAVWLMLVTTAYSLAASTQPLVTVEWLESHLKDKNVVILDVRTFPKYMKSHIPGAVRAFGPWRTMNEQFVGFMAPPVEELEKMLQEYGVSNSSMVIIYDQGMTSSDTAKSARAVWTLHWLGHENCALLDGGFNAWEQKELPVDTAPAIRPKGDFRASPQPEKVITLAEVRKKMGDGTTVFVDLREPFQHFGHEKKSNIARYGHLTGSLLMPAAYMTIGGQNFSPAFLRSKEELQQMAAGAGIPDRRDQEIVVYSNTGEQAALGYFVLDTILGYTNVRLFDGSMLEAAKAKDIPISMYAWGWNEKGAVKGR